jgi:RimJ/RimL family protein N-acetyltransferase
VVDVAWFLKTPRLTLRPQTVGDAAVQHRLWTERDPRVPPHRRIDSDGHPTEQDIAEGIRSLPDGSRLLTVERRLEGDVIGYCGLVFSENGDDGEPELAFELLAAVHGNGYATEAGRAVIGWAAEAGHSRLWATVWDWNVASLRVLDKLGFRDTGRPGRVSEHGRIIVTVRGG